MMNLKVFTILARQTRLRTIIFMRKLRQATGTTIGLPAFKWMLKIVAAVIGTEPELILKSRWVVPTKLLQAGYQFAYPDIDGAFKNIVTRVPRSKYHLF
jgi:hypothetical protein